MRYLFGRLLTISTTEKIDLEKVLQYPLTPVPYHYRILMEVLMHQIESYFEESTAPIDIDVCIVDATFLLHIQKHHPLTFGQQAVTRLSQLTRMPQQVHTTWMKFDGIQYHRSKPVHTQWLTICPQIFILFRSEFVQFLYSEWIKSPDAEIISRDLLYLALDDTCHCLTAADGDVTCITVPALQSFHEEADTRMVYHVDFVAHEATIITIRSNVTDVLIILLYVSSRYTNQSLVRCWFCQ